MKKLELDTGWTNLSKTYVSHSIVELSDKNEPAGPPLATLLVTRKEVATKAGWDQPVSQASICITYEVLKTQNDHTIVPNGEFCGGYSRTLGGHGMVSLSSARLAESAIFLDPEYLRGHRLGTFFMNEIVSWAKNFGSADVKPIELDVGQADPTNKARRNRFYEQFGLKFDFKDSRLEAGVARPMLAQSLTTVDSWKKNIRVRYIQEVLAQDRHAAKMLSIEVDRLKDANERLVQAQQRAEKHPVAWAYKHTKSHVMQWLKIACVAGSVLALVGLGAWRAFNAG